MHKKPQLLEAAGYEVLEAKPTVNVRMEIDGQTYPFAIKGDLLVKRSGRLFVARIRKEKKQSGCTLNYGGNACCAMPWLFGPEVYDNSLGKGKVQEVCFRL